METKKGIKKNGGVKGTSKTQMVQKQKKDGDKSQKKENTKKSYKRRLAAFKQRITELKLNKEVSLQIIEIN